MPFQCVIKNFIAAKEVKFTVAGFTLIKGESSSGKSSSLKAIYAAMTNTFSPSQIRWGEKSAEIKLRFDPTGPMLSVLRPRSGSPTMSLGGQEFSRMARAVPQEVEEFLNIGSVKSGTETVSLNFMSQFQPPLLHAFSHRRIADLISSSSALDDYNISVKAVSAKREQLKGAFNMVDSAMSSLKETIATKEGSLQCQKVPAEALRGLIGEYSKGCERLEGLKSVRGAYGKRDQVHSVNLLRSNYLRSLDSVSVHLSDKVSFQEVGKEMSRVQSTKTRVVLAKKAHSSLECLQGVKLRMQGLENLCLSVGQLTVVRRKQAKAQVALQVVNSLYAITQSAEAAKSFRLQLSTLNSLVEGRAILAERIQFNNNRVAEGVCPLCGSNIKDCNMTLDEIAKKREELKQQIASDEAAITQLDARISLLCEQLGVAPDKEAIDAAIVECQAKVEAAEAQASKYLEELNSLEK